MSNENNPAGKTAQEEESILNAAYLSGKTIQANHNGIWEDFIPHNQLDKPNWKYRGIDNWRIKPDTPQSLGDRSPSPVEPKTLAECNEIASREAEAFWGDRIDEELEEGSCLTKGDLYIMAFEKGFKQSSASEWRDVSKDIDVESVKRYVAVDLNGVAEVVSGVRLRSQHRIYKYYMPLPALPNQPQR